MSPRSSKAQQAPPQMDVFVALLMISTVALAVGCGLLWGVLQYGYGFAMP